MQRHSNMYLCNAPPRPMVFLYKTNVFNYFGAFLSLDDDDKNGDDAAATTADDDDDCHYFCCRFCSCCGRYYCKNYLFLLYV